MALQEADWSNLPDHLLNLILSNIPNVIYRIWFGAVCRSWHLAVEVYHYELRLRHGYKTLPMMIMPAEDNPTARRLYSLTDNKVLDILLPVGFKNRSCGSSYGWLAFPTFEKNDTVITLFNPFKGIAIPLPPLKDNPELFMKVGKVVLSADPASSPNTCAVAVIYGYFNRLAFLEPGCKTWNKLDDELYIFSDVLFYKNLVYAVTQHRIMVIFDVNRPPMVNMLMSRSSAVDRMFYLVESSLADLLFVENIKMVDDEGNTTENFKVYKMRFDLQTGAVIEEAELKTLEGDAVFIDYSSSVAIPAQNFPGCKPNSIYHFTSYGPRHLSIFNLEDGHFTQHYEFEFNQSAKFLVWILPPY